MQHTNPLVSTVSGVHTVHHRSRRYSITSCTHKEVERVLEHIFVPRAGLLNDHLRVKDHVAAKQQQAAILPQSRDTRTHTQSQPQALRPPPSVAPYTSAAVCFCEPARRTKFRFSKSDECATRFSTLVRNSIDSAELRIPPKYKYERRVAGPMEINTPYTRAVSHLQDTVSSSDTAVERTDEGTCGKTREHQRRHQSATATYTHPPTHKQHHISLEFKTPHLSTSATAVARSRPYKAKTRVPASTRSATATSVDTERPIAAEIAMRIPNRRLKFCTGSR